MTTLRLKTRLRLLNLLVFSLLLFFIIFPLVEFSPKDFVANAWGIALLILILIEIFFFGSVLTLIWKYHVEFQETGFSISPITIFKKRSQCQYSEVADIKKGILRDNLVILRRLGKPIQLSANAFEGGRERLLCELRQHIPEDRFAPGLEVNLKSRNGYDYAAIVLAILLVPFVLITYYFQAGSSLHNWVAWKSEVPYLDGFLTSVAIADDQSVWWLEKQEDSQAVLFHKTVNGLESWDLPQRTEKYEYYDSQIIWDSKSQPVVVTDYFYLRFENGAWNNYPYLPSIDYLWTTYDRYVVKDDQIWALANNSEADGNVLFHFDVTTGEQEILPWPDSIMESPKDIAMAPNGDLFVLWESDSQISIYALTPDRTWESRYTQAGINDVDFMVVAGDNTLWLIHETDKDEYQLNKITLLDGIQTSTAISLIEENKRIGETLNVFDSFQIDSRGRVWIMTSNFLGVYQPVWGSQAQLLVLYTEDNSNYQESWMLPILSMDGRLWVGGNDRIVWIDTTEDKLPSPLPYLETGMDSLFSSGFYFVFSAFFCVWILFFMAVRKGSDDV